MLEPCLLQACFRVAGPPPPSSSSACACARPPGPSLLVILISSLLLLLLLLLSLFASLPALRVLAHVPQDCPRVYMCEYTHKYT